MANNAQKAEQEMTQAARRATQKMETLAAILQKTFVNATAQVCTNAKIMVDITGAALDSLGRQAAEAQQNIMQAAKASIQQAFAVSVVLDTMQKQAAKASAAARQTAQANAETVRDGVAQNLLIAESDLKRTVLEGVAVEEQMQRMRDQARKDLSLGEDVNQEAALDALLAQDAAYQQLNARCQQLTELWNLQNGKVLIQRDLLAKLNAQLETNSAAQGPQTGFGEIAQQILIANTALGQQATQYALLGQAQQLYLNAAPQPLALPEHAGMAMLQNNPSLVKETTSFLPSLTNIIGGAKEGFQSLQGVIQALCGPFTTIKETTSSVFGNLAEHFKEPLEKMKNGASQSFNDLKERLEGPLQAVKQLGAMVFNEMKQGLQNVIAASPQLLSSVNAVKGSIELLKSTLGTIAAPVVEALAPIFVSICNAAITAANAIAMFVARLSGKGTYMRAAQAAKSYSGSMSGAGQAAKNATQDVKELEKATNTLGLDELNVVQPQEANSASGGSGGAGGGGGDAGSGGGLFLEEVAIDNDIANFADGLLAKLGPLKKAFSGLQEELDRLGKFAWEGLMDFYDTFLVPVGNWTLGTGLPRFINAITNGLASIEWSRINKSLHGLWEALAPFAIHI